MDAISTITHYGPWLWFAAGVALLVLETGRSGRAFSVVWNRRPLIVGAIALATPLAWQIQLVIFALISIASVFLVRRYSVTDGAKTDEPRSLNVRGAQYIGRTVEVDAIRNGRGKVRVGDFVWVAEGEDAAIGAKVEVQGVNGTVLVVAKPDTV